MEHYRGNRYLRGHGLGDIFSQLFRTGIPLLKKAGGYLGEKLLNMGVNTLSEVRKGRKFKDAIRSQALKSRSELIGDAKSKIKKKFFGGGKKRVLKRFAHSKLMTGRTIKRAAPKRKRSIKKRKKCSLSRKKTKLTLF